MRMRSPLLQLDLIDIDLHFLIGAPEGIHEHDARKRKSHAFLFRQELTAVDEQLKVCVIFESADATPPFRSR